MYKIGDKCPVCGEGKLIEEIITEEFEYKGKKRSVPNYHIFRCGHCKEELVGRQTLRETEKILTDFRRTVDGLLTTEEIKTIRKKMGETQIQFAKRLGVGEKNFARYENGQVMQSKPMDLLLRILDKWPTVLETIKESRNYATHNNLSVRCQEELEIKYTINTGKHGNFAEGEGDLIAA